MNNTEKQSQQKTQKKLFSFDAETDGLYGEVWAIGAVVFDDKGTEVERFEGQVKTSELKNQWVLTNVVPYVRLPLYQTRRALRNAFWSFWMKHREGATCIVDEGSPVEVGLIRACIEDDPKNRQGLEPYPIHEVATMLLAKGIDPSIDRFEFTHTLGLIEHNPIDDAYVSALCWLKLTRSGDKEK